MQERVKDFDAAQHDMYKAVVLPDAMRYCKAVYRDEDGVYHAEKEEAVMPFGTSYRGDIVVCSDTDTIGFVELVSIIEREGDMVWRFRNPRRVVEMPIRGGQGLFNLVVPKGDLTEYPRIVRLQK